MQTTLSIENLSSMDDEVEILEPHSASTTFFASRNSNPRRLEAQARFSLQNSVNSCQGTDLICTCDDNEVAACLRTAVERKDFGFVFETLRGRELRFKKSEGAMEKELKALKRELVAVREAEGKKFSKLREEYKGLKVKHRETETQLKDLTIKHRETETHLEDLTVKHRETETQLEDLRKLFDKLSKCYREKVSEGLKEIVPGCESPHRGHADAGVRTPFMETSTPKCLEKGKVKRILDFDGEDNIHKGKQDRVADALPFCSVDNVVNRVLSPHCGVDVVSHGLGLGGFEVDGLGNDGIEENRESEPMGIGKRSGDEKPSCVDLGACEEKPPKDGLQSSIPGRKIDMEGKVAVGTTLGIDVVILSDSECESSGPSLGKKSLSPCSEKATCTPKKQDIEEEIHSRVKTGGVSDDGGEYLNQSEGQPLRRGAKRRCQMAVSSSSESSSSDVGFICKRGKPRSGNSQKQENVQCETSPKDPKEDAVLGVPHETYEYEVLDRNMGNEDSLAWKDVPDMKLKRIRKTKNVNELLTVEHCDEDTDEIQGEPSPGARFRRLKRVVEGNELTNTEQLDEGMCSVERPKVTKYRRLKRGDGEADGPEECNVGNVAEKNTVDQYINDVNDDAIFNDNVECTSSMGGSTFTKKCKSGGATKVAEEPSDSPIYTQNNRRLRSQSRKMINLTKESEDDNAECTSSMGGSTFAKKGKSGGATTVAEGPSDSPIYPQNNRRLRSQSRKMINLTKESDGEDEDEDESDSQTDDLGDFIVDSSESEKDSECADGSKSDSENSSNNLGSAAETNPSSGDDLDDVIRKLSRQKERKLDWKYEGEMLAAFAKDDVLCMRAVCALYRQQTNDERRGKSSLHLNRRGFDKFHATRGSLIAEFLTDNDPSGPMSKSLQELQKHDSSGAEYCKNLAIHHSKQLFEIYRNDEDPHFPHE